MAHRCRPEAWRAGATAWALYRQPDVLFLDEGTANLDPACETRIADMIAAMDITRVVIAHRPALVERADIVVRLDKGKIAVSSRFAPDDAPILRRA